MLHGKIINKLTHASPAWWGFASVHDRNRLETFLRKCTKLGYRAKHSTSFACICDDADCKLFTRITAQHLLYPLLPLNASITTLSLFVNAVTTFNYLIVHPLLETEILLWECCIVMLFTDNSIFSSYSLCNSVLSVILLKLKWMKWYEWNRIVCLLCVELSVTKDTAMWVQLGALTAADTVTDIALRWWHCFCSL